MIVYLASPNNSQQAEHLEGMPVLLSFALWSPFMDQYHPGFKRILIDSGAFSEMNSGKKVDLAEYRDWIPRWGGHADAVAGLDDIQGDWKRSLANYEAVPGTFPTFHDTDPPQLLDDLIPMARERGGWLGLGLMPPRQGKEAWVRAACDRIPDDLHVHGFALRLYTHIRRLDSVDSTNWWRDAAKIRNEFPWLHWGEALEIIVKRYQRWKRIIEDPKAPEPSLFGPTD